ncbi:Fe(3+)-hydroxamate ABC transporter permease FhuB [Neisseria sp. Ec49-e6-T10]|uniref:Fe(3+)-hydroxamate ABC transporter permease FhuB n=1 Tax=Neisseria sp. Ec49-e6-T10 TaxID=3140744 RepID=UPI003EC11023
MVKKTFQFQPILLTHIVLLLLCSCSVFLLLKTQLIHTRFFDLFHSEATLSLEAFLVQNNVLPRLFMAVLVGGALGLCSMVLQQMTHNPLAADTTLAVGSGAQLVLFVVSIFLPQYLIGYADVWALFGSGLSLFLVLLLSLKNGLIPIRMILAGLIVSLYMGALSSVLMIFFSEEASGILLWGSGSLVQDSWQDCISLGGRLLICALILSSIIRPMQIMGLGDTQAKSIGVPVGVIRFIGLLVAAYLCASVVSMVGMFGFVGLAAASIVRQLKVRKLGQQFVYAFSVGGLLLLLTDSLLQLLQNDTQWQLSTGSVTALIGAPILLWLIFRTFNQPQQVMAEAIVQERSKQYKKMAIGLVILGLIISVLFSLFFSKGILGWHWTGWDVELIPLRYPRLLSAVAAGLMLSIAGVILQKMTQNPMASPELLGISSGTAIGLLVGVFFSITQPVLLWLIGVFSAFITLMILSLINRNNGMLPDKVLLTGIAIAALFDALIRLFLASGDPRIQMVLVWLAGSTYQATAAVSIGLSILAVVFFIVSLFLYKWLDLLGLNNTIAQSVGLNIPVARKLLIVFCAVLTALATLIMGPLSFVGLFAPHLARVIGFHRTLSQLMVAAIFGTWLMVFADWLGRYLVFPYEIPAGLVATLLGGAYFLFMLRKI